MNVFVLCTGRCGSTSFFEACRHAKNYSASHEDKRSILGRPRFEYPENHIAVDYRLSWMLGRLDLAYGKNAFYVHLLRDPQKVAQSFARMAQIERSSSTVIDKFDLPNRLNRMGAPVWAHMHVQAQKTFPLDLVAEDMVRSINSDIKLFLKDKQWTSVQVETVEEDFPKFWGKIGAQGDLAIAMNEWRVIHNDIDTVEGKASAAANS